MSRETAPLPDDALVVGASRGLGLALTRQLLEEKTHARVFATHRGTDVPDGLEVLRQQHGGKLVLMSCELSDDGQIHALGQSLEERGTDLALVIHAAGILHETDLRPEKALRQLKRESLLRLFNINSIAPLLLAKAIMPSLRKEQPAHFAALSAMVGSIGDNRLGGWYGYRASKAALNQLLRTLAIECRRTHANLCVTSIHPGTTDTGLSRPYQGNVAADKLYAPARSAKRILKVIRAGTPEDSGRFMNWDGRRLDW